MAARKKGLSQAQIAKFVGNALGRSYSDTAVQKWAQAGAPYVSGPGSIKDLVEWVRTRKEEPGKTQLTPKEAAELRDKLASAKIKELKLARMEGTLGYWDDMRRAVAKHITDSRQLLNTLPEALAMLIPDLELREIVREESERIVDDACRTLSKSRQALEELAKQEHDE
jgi:hypothetical protein